MRSACGSGGQHVSRHALRRSRSVSVSLSFLKPEREFLPNPLLRRPSAGCSSSRAACLSFLLSFFLSALLRVVDPAVSLPLRVALSLSLPIPDKEPPGHPGVLGRRRGKNLGLACCAFEVPTSTVPPTRKYLQTRLFAGHLHLFPMTCPQGRLLWEGLWNLCSVVTVTRLYNSLMSRTMLSHLAD